MLFSVSPGERTPPFPSGIMTFIPIFPMKMKG